jgi:hypothetical protein
VITDPSASPPIIGGDAFRRPRKPRPVAASQTSPPPRADVMTIDYMDVFLQRVACIRADGRYEFELPRAPDCAVARVSDRVVGGRSPVTGAAVRQVMSE